MFNLENAIAEWRREMVAGKVRQPEILNELESHLRDEIAEQTRAGIGTEEAFAYATRSIGHAETLRKEFKKIVSLGSLIARLGRGMRAMAEGPNHYFDTTMNNSSFLESRWATYLRSAAFLLPAIFLWAVSTIFFVPKFQTIWVKSGIDAPGWWGGIFHLNFALMFFFKDNLTVIASVLAVALALLEWRSERWAQFRRATLGAGVFLLNLTVLLSFFILFVAETYAASTLAQHVK